MFFWEHPVYRTFELIELKNIILSRCGDAIANGKILYTWIHLQITATVCHLKE